MPRFSLAARSLFLMAACLAATVAGAVVPRLEITIDAGDHARKGVPVQTVAKLAGWGKSCVLADADGKRYVAQLSDPGLLAEPVAAGADEVVRQVTLVVDHLPAGETLKLTSVVGEKLSDSGQLFAWHDLPGEHRELRLGQQPVLRYMYAPLDDSSNARREETYKVYHHLFAPDGSRIVTKGPGGRYTHHRGLYYGFNRIKYGNGKSADTWHCRGKAYQSHEGFLAADIGPVLGRHRIAIGWHGQEGEIFANEEREMTAYAVGDGQLIEFASRLKSAEGAVHLDGDPQHAGFQFRADNEVAAQTASQTYYLRTDGKGKAGETRNWSKGNAECENRPWNAMSFVLGDERYTAVYLDRPENPKPARYSERDYGRFGSYFVYDLDGRNSLDLNYRVWLQKGEMTVDEVASLSAAFVDPPTMKVSVAWD